LGGIKFESVGDDDVLAVGAVGEDSGSIRGVAGVGAGVGVRPSEMTWNSSQNLVFSSCCAYHDSNILVILFSLICENTL